MLLFANILELKAQSGQKWSTSGNSTSNGDFIGTTNNEPLLLKTNNQTIIRLKPSGDIIFKPFENLGTGLLGFDNDGKVLPFTFNGSTNTFLNGAGQFVNISGLSGWKIDPANDNLFQTTSGYVGIGTNNPQLKLHVAGDALVEGYVFTQGISIIGRAWGQKLYSDTIDVKLIEMDSLKSISGETRINGSASVSQKFGVGTKYPEAELDVRGNMALSGEARIDGYIKIPSLANANNNLLYTDGTGIVKPIALEQLSLGFFSQPKKTCLLQTDVNYIPVPMVWNATDTKMWLNPVGPCNKLGIGTDNPQEAVDIVGNTNISGRLKVGNNSIIIESLGSGSGILNNIYADNNGNMHLQPNNKSTGNIGIGLTTTDVPDAKITIKGGNSWTNQNWKKAVKIDNGSALQFASNSIQYGIGASGDILYMFNTGTNTTGANANYNFVLDGNGDVCIGSNYDPRSKLEVYTSENNNYAARIYNTGGSGSGLLINSGAGSGAGSALLVQDGYGINMLQVNSSNYRTDIWGSLYVNGVQIGPANATGVSSNNLDICGTIRAKEIIVEFDGEWCDYVFDDDYNLLSIKEKEKYLKKNKHLPSIKSAKTIDEEGITISETIKGLLKETEELTLYVIQLNKKIEELETELKKK